MFFISAGFKVVLKTDFITDPLPFSPKERILRYHSFDIDFDKLICTFGYNGEINDTVCDFKVGLNFPFKLPLQFRFYASKQNGQMTSSRWNGIVCEHRENEIWDKFVAASHNILLIFKVDNKLTI